MRKLVYFWLACTALLAWHWTPRIAPSETLQFKDRAFPPGFRELVLDRGISQPDALAGLSQRQPRGPTESIATSDICNALFHDSDSPPSPTPAPKLQIVSFLDYRCPYCKKISKILMSIETSDIRIIFKEWPILGADSVLAARAALAASKQGKYRAFHARLMDGRLVPTQAYLEAVASEVGLNQAELRSDMNTQSVAMDIQRVSALASSLNLIGTPALVVGRTIVQGEITQNQLKQLIDDEIKPQSHMACENRSRAARP